MSTSQSAMLQTDQPQSSINWASDGVISQGNSNQSSTGAMVDDSSATNRILAELLAQREKGAVI